MENKPKAEEDDVQIGKILNFKRKSGINFMNFKNDSPILFQFGSNTEVYSKRC